MAEGGLAALSVEEFLRRLGGGDPTPGGGAASALAAALGASLVSMVCNLTIGRPRCAEYDAEAPGSRPWPSCSATASEVHRSGCRRVRRGDRSVSATPGDGRAEGRAVRCDPGGDPRRGARPAERGRGEQYLIDLAEQALGKTNPNAVSDLAVAALLGVAALDGAAANVEINLSSLEDEQERTRIAERLASAREVGASRRCGSWSARG